MKALVLGCGPAGLLAAHALAQQEVEFEIVSRKVPSTIAGAQFLHRSIPGLTPDEPDAFVEFIYKGTKEEYAHKIYGSYEAPTSWGTYPSGDVPVWSLRQHYTDLWERYHHYIVDGELSRIIVMDAMHNFDIIISTIPKRIIWPLGEYKTEEVVIVNDLLQLGHGDWIIYNGEHETHWYRRSSLFGVQQTEYPAKMTPLVDGHKVGKPLNSNQPDNFGNIVCMGRYGRWKKGILVHDAYFETLDVINDLH